MNEYYLGVDGGQSSTAAMIADRSGKVLGWASAGPCNHVAEAERRSKFLRVMGECLRQAAERAGIQTEKPRFAAACIGMSGGPEDKEELLRELIDAEHMIVTHDARIALAGAMPGDPGLIVIAGTGSIAFGENSAGETSRAGGWGYVFGDEGGGFDIARQGLQAILREHEGWGPRTALTPLFLEAIGAANANEALHRLYMPDFPRSRTAGLAVLVSQAAEAGDPSAAEILDRAAHQLALLVRSVHGLLWKEDESFRVSWIGGVFRSPMLLERFRTLAGNERGAIVAAPLHSPVMGALTLAWKARGVDAVPQQPHPMKT